MNMVNVKFGGVALAIAALLLFCLGLGYGFSSSGQQLVLEAKETPVGTFTVRIGPNKTDV
jgi:hypothetical protein